MSTPAASGGTPEAATGAAKRSRKPGSGHASHGVAVPASKRSRKKKNINITPNKTVAAIIPESAYFSQLVEFERRIDTVLARKKADIEAILKTPEVAKQRLRVYVYNTFENQGGQSDEVPGWTLLIYGRVVPGPQNPGTPVPMTQTFSALLKNLEVILDPEQYPGREGHIRWTNADHSGPHSEAFEIKRKGSKPCQAKIRIGLHHVPEQFRLSEALAAVVGLKQETRSGVIRAVWSYIKTHHLQSANNPTMAECDDKLKAIFGESRVVMSSIVPRLAAHLREAPPIELEYTIGTEGESPSHPDCYEMDVEVPATHPPQLVEFLQKHSKDRELETYNARITGAIEKINEHRRRRAFFLGFSQSPVDFINSLVASQARDLRTASAGGRAECEALRKTEVFQGKWVEDAVFRYLQRRTAVGQ